MRYMSYIRSPLVLILSVLVLGACAQPEPVENPIKDIRQNHQDVKSYSLILKNMKVNEESDKFLHRYELVAVDGDSTFREDLGWKEVPYDLYENHKSDLNTTILSKKGGDLRKTPHPPGYQYVGNEQYGQWKQRDDGTSFWEFYGKYAMFQNVVQTFGAQDHRIRRNDYRTYRTHVRTGQPYYSNGRFGTRGKYTRTNHTSKYRSVRNNNRTFKSKSWGGRSRSSARGRSGGFGK